MSIGMARPRILLAHANADCQLIYGSVLTYDGCDVDVTADVASALARLSRSHYDVVIADLYLPSEGDECLLRVLKAMPSLAHIPVVILTGWTTEQHRNTALEHAADRFFGLPLRPRELSAIILDLVDHPLPARVPSLPVLPTPNHQTARGI
jgi:DNA-binding response OmpR family regulator